MNKLPTHRLLITGANGQLGQEIKYLSTHYFTWTFLFCDRQLLDITNPQQIQQQVEQFQPTIIINCAAYTQVDLAETEVKQATAINETGVQYLAKICEQKEIPLIHISTDFVFDGSSTKPYLEEDSTAPLGVYGQTKLAGEQHLQDSQCDYLIIRTSWVYSSFGKNFVKTMLRLGESRPQLKVVNDQIGSPTYARDLARQILYLAARLKKEHFRQTYHYTGQGTTSWCGFATEIMKQAGLNCEVLPIPSSGYPTPAKRPAYSVLNTQKIITTFERDIPHWQDSLKVCLAVIKAKSKTN